MLLITFQKIKNKMKKRQIPKFEIKFNGVDSDVIINNAPEEMKECIFNETLFAIEDGINLNKKEIKLFQIKNHYLTIKKDNWSKILHGLIPYFSSQNIEDYETCSKITNLIKLI